MITPFRLRHITASVAPQILMLFANLLLSSKQRLTECIEERHTMILIDSRRPTVDIAHYRDLLSQARSTVWHPSPAQWWMIAWPLNRNDS